MDTKLTPVSRYDHLDAEAWKAMLDSPLWARFEQRVQAELDRARSACERGESAAEIRRAQGAVKMARVILSIPQQMLTDMKQGRAPGARRGE